MSMIKLSIITVNYNNCSGLHKTLVSVQKQTARDSFEFIIVDGKSTDGSLELINEYDTLLIDKWISESDNGIYEAMNKGISIAEGEYLLFLNSGDWLYNDFVIESCLPYFKADIVYGNAWFKKGKREWVEKYPSKLSFYFFYQYTLNHQSTFIKASLFNDYGMYREDLKINSDWEFFPVLNLIKVNAT